MNDFDHKRQNWFMTIKEIKTGTGSMNQISWLSEANWRSWVWEETNFAKIMKFWNERWNDPRVDLGHSWWTETTLRRKRKVGIRGEVKTRGG